MRNLYWRNMRLKYLFKKRIAGAWGNEPDENNSMVCIRAADFDTEKIRHKKVDLTLRSYTSDEIEKKKLIKGDLIIEKSGGGDNQPVGRVTLFSLEELALCSNFLEILRPKNDILDSVFGAFLLYSLWLNRVTTPAIKQTTGIQNLDLEEYLDIKVNIPPISTQELIAAYLDRETAHIDALIAAKERLLTLLDEKRKALIARAVTRGLDPDVKMKDSGVKWLGEVPEGWEVERAKWLFRERNERSETGDEDLLTVSHLTGITLRSEKDVNMFEAETTEGYKVTHPNDLVINTLWAWMGAMGISPLHGIVSPAYHVYALSERLDPSYVDAIVRTPFFATEVTRFSKGVWSSRLRLYPEGLYEVLFPVPPIKEQRLIVAYIKKETRKLDALRTTTERSIALLKERRSALIAAAVTGKMEKN